MVGHENVGVNVAAALVGVLPQPVEIKAVVFIRIKARLPVVAPLDNVKRDVRQSQAGAARHVVCLLITEIERNLSLKPWSVPCCREFAFAGPGRYPTLK